MIKEVIGNATLYCGDSNEILDSVDAVDSCVTDPPYGLSFMGKQWDYDVPQQELWVKVYQSIKQGGHLLSFFGSRTYHRGVIPIEDAGFEIRDQLMWLYGSGFPKSHNIGKKIKEYEGWGTALKPAHEPIVMARKPFKGTVAENVLEHGTGGINIDGCRVGIVEDDDISKKNPHTKGGFGHKDAHIYGKSDGADEYDYSQGRFPANVMHDGSEVVLDIFPHTKSGKMKQHIEGGKYNVYGKMYPRDVETIGDEGSASRFFYCAKASKKDRDEGLDMIDEKAMAWSNQAKAELKRGNLDFRNADGDTAKHNKVQMRKNSHPTVKPTELMRYLCRLVTPKGGVVLDPFMGSGSTGKGALLEGFKFIGIEMEREYFDIACARLEAVQKNAQKDMF